jgi:hypothetical protein
MGLFPAQDYTSGTHVTYLLLEENGEDEVFVLPPVLVYDSLDNDWIIHLPVQEGLSLNLVVVFREGKFARALNLGLFSVVLNHAQIAVRQYEVVRKHEIVLVLVLDNSTAPIDSLGCILFFEKLSCLGGCVELIVLQLAFKAYNAYLRIMN